MSVEANDKRIIFFISLFNFCHDGMPYYLRRQYPRITCYVFGAVDDWAELFCAFWLFIRGLCDYRHDRKLANRWRFHAGGIYKGIYLDVPDKKARQIFVGLIATFFFLLLSLLMAEPEAFLGIPNFLSYLFILIIIFIFSVIFILRKRM